MDRSREQPEREAFRDSTRTAAKHDRELFGE
jgi:hypothetical protein